MLVVSFLLGALLVWLWMSGLLDACLRLLTGRWLTPPERVEQMPAEQWLLNTEARPHSSWRLLGLWREARSYPQACLDLVGLIADRACLSESDSVLDVEFGSYDQLLFWADYYQPRSIIGLSSNVERRQEALDRAGHYASLKVSSGRPEQLDVIAQSGSLDKIFALDCAYRFHNKQQFFQRAATALKPGGCLILTDMVLARAPLNRWEERALRILARLVGFRLDGVWQADAYRAVLQQAGFSQIEFQDYTEEVLSGFCFWVSQHRRQLRQVTAPHAWLRVTRLETFIKSMMARGILRYQVILVRSPQTQI